MYPLKKMKKSAKKMRNDPTSSEEMAYKLLKKAGFVFNKQKIFGFYILDILIPNRLLIVEIDGPIHIKGNKHDRRRDEYCKNHGLNILRIKNKDVKSIVKKVLKFKKVKYYKKKLDKILIIATNEQKEYEKQYNINGAKRSES